MTFPAYSQIYEHVLLSSERIVYALDLHPHHGADVPMPTELIFIALDDARLTALAQASEDASLTVEEIVQVALSEFLDERRSK
jgi:hypothetical protein